RIELSEPAPVEILKIGIGARKRQINVIEHSRIARSRLAGRTRHQALGERGNRRGIIVIEERAMPLGSRMRLCWRSILGFSGGCMLRAGDSPGADERADQKRSSSRLHFAFPFCGRMPVYISRFLAPLLSRGGVAARQRKVAKPH